MDTSNNPFASDSVPFQKPGLLLDLGASADVFKQNGTSPSANDLYFLDRPANGKGNFDDDDFGPETDVDAVDDILLSPTKIANSPKNNNPFEDVMEKRAFEEELEIQRKETSEFDPVRETRQETPTPPADEVSGVTNLVPEPDNVAESGEDSDDEWNYYRVEPTAEAADTNQQSTQEVCEKSAQQLEEEENMESQLNPNAAEFVPSPTQLMPSMEDILLAESPKKGITMENISVPSHKEFQQEANQRPSELDMTDESQMIPQQKIAAKLPDLISTEEGGDANPFLPPGAICGKSIHHLENGGSFKDFLEQGDRNFQELQDSNLQASGGLILDESEVSSTKAEFGDDSNMSFMTSELQRTVVDSVSSFIAMEKSFSEHETLETELTSSDVNELSKFNDSEFFRETTTEESLQEEDSIIKNTQDAVHMSFEIQKELVPEMESKPERVQLESEGTSSIEQDDSSSPVQADSKVQDFAEKVTTDLEVPVNEEKNDSSKVDVDLPTAEVSNSEQNKLLLPDVDSVPLSQKSLQEDEQLSPSPVLPELSGLQIEDGLLLKLSGDGGLSPASPLSPKLSQSPPQSPILSNKSLQSPPQSPLLSKPELSPLQPQDLQENLEASPKSPLTQEPQSPPKSPMLEQLQLSDLSIPMQQQIESPQSPVLSKSPVWEASSPIPSAADTALSTPETVPVGKDETPSPLLETKSPVDNFYSVTETHLQTSQDKILEEVEDIFSVRHDEQLPQVNVSEFDITDLRHPSNKLLTDFNLEESLAESSDFKPLDDSAIQVPPPTPAHVSEDVPSTELLAESDSLVEKLDLSTETVGIVSEKIDLETEKVEERKEEASEIITPTVAAAAVGGVVAAAAAAVGVVKAVEEKPAEKKLGTEAKKTATPAKDKKGPVPEKTKTTKTTTTKPGTPTTAKLNQKSTPTSPTKPLSTTVRTSTPKKGPLTTTSTTSTLTSKVTKSPATPTAKPKSTTGTTLTSRTVTSTTRTTSTTKPTTASSRPKPTGTTTTSRSAVMTNGESTKPAAIRKPGTTTTAAAAAKPPSRPATAPAATKTATTKQVTSVTSRTTVTTSPRPKPGAVNGTTTTTKPRTMGTIAPATARSKVGIARDTKLVTDKQVKETANKQISSSRSVTATKSATMTTAKRVSGVTKTSTSVTNAAKSATSKTATKKTMATATSKTTTKTAVTVTTTATENNELVKVQQVVD